MAFPAAGNSDTGPEADLLDVNDLVRMFEESEDSSLDARGQAERDRDYYDGKQLTADEQSTLRKRGQPVVIDNRIKDKIDFLLGLEKQQRMDPKALPRTPVHEDDADGCTQALRYVTEEEGYKQKRSACWKNLLVEGAAGIAVAVKSPRSSATQVSLGGTPPMLPSPDGSPLMAAPPQIMDVTLRRVAWDRMFWDPHSSEPDFSDSFYLGVVVWMDWSEALAQYGDTPENRNALEVTMQTSTISQTYDDKPKFRIWADKKRKRVRIVQMWIKRDEQWYFAEFTKGGILKAGPSPYKTDAGESDCELIFQSAYVDRDNNRYGLVREMISLQDGVNKRHSKALHLLNTAQIVMTEGALSALNDVEKVRKEAAKPDGVIVVAEGNRAIEERFQFNTRSDLAGGQLQLLQEMKQAIDLKGPNATMLGDKTGGGQAASGKAIIASQQGGIMSIGDLSDNLRHLDLRVYRAIWNRIRQFWNGEKWLRVTDDENNVKWVGINVDRARLQMAMQQNPQMGQKIAGAIGRVAELDCDIILDEAPDALTPQLEQFQALVELKKFDKENEIPFRAIVQAMPNLKNKAAILSEIDKNKAPSPQQQAVQQLKFRGAAAEVADKEAAGILKRAQAAKAAHDATAPHRGHDTPVPTVATTPGPDGIEIAQRMADLENTRAGTLAKLAAAEASASKARDMSQLDDATLAAMGIQRPQPAGGPPAPAAQPVPPAQPPARVIPFPPHQVA